MLTRLQGSTCAFAERILRNCGRRTGLFTSPHLTDVRERFQVDGCERLSSTQACLTAYQRAG